MPPVVEVEPAMIRPMPLSERIALVQQQHWTSTPQPMPSAAAMAAMQARGFTDIRRTYDTGPDMADGYVLMGVNPSGHFAIMRFTVTPFDYPGVSQTIEITPASRIEGPENTVLRHILIAEAMNLAVARAKAHRGHVDPSDNPIPAYSVEEVRLQIQKQIHDLVTGHTGQTHPTTPAPQAFATNALAPAEQAAHAPGTGFTPLPPGLTELNTPAYSKIGAVTFKLGTFAQAERPFSGYYWLRIENPNAQQRVIYLPVVETKTVSYDDLNVLTHAVLREQAVGHTIRSGRQWEHEIGNIQHVLQRLPITPGSAENVTTDHSRFAQAEPRPGNIPNLKIGRQTAVG